jgi:hypothetical protein
VLCESYRTAASDAWARTADAGRAGSQELRGGCWQIACSVPEVEKARLALRQEFLQDNGMVAGAIASGEEKRDRTSCGLFQHAFCKVMPGFKFLEIPRAKLAELRLVVAEPFAKRGGRSQLFRPAIDMGIGFFQAPRPQAVHEDSKTVVVGW